MKKVLRRRISTWSLLTIVAVAGLVIAAALALNKPLPEYLVAKVDFRPGEKISKAQLESLPINLGEAGSAYLNLRDFDEGYVVTDFVSKGELLPIRQLSMTQSPDWTTVVLEPSLEISPSIGPGSWVQIWRTIENSEGFLSERLVERSQVISMRQGESLVSSSVSQIEVKVSEEQSAIILQTLSAEQDIYVLVTL
jgi:multidrug efflux pump subunit AcrA (membrane-fusion protein)